MHELSIALSILDVAEEEMQRHPGAKLDIINLRLGKLSGVVKEALASAYELAREPSPFPLARLVIEEVSGNELQIASLELEAPGELEE